MSDNKSNHNPVPWLPEESFWKANNQPIRNIFQILGQNHPADHVPKIRAGGNHPTLMQKKWMFTKLLGHQHGRMEGIGGKIDIPGSEEHLYWPDFSRISYGDYSFSIPTRVNTGKEYSKAFVLAGTQEENVDRLMAVQGYSPTNENINEVVVMAGQRLRGIWPNMPGESSLDDLLAITAIGSDADLHELTQQSPYIKEQLAKTGVEWEQPFASEYEMCRLAVEAVFQQQIDWKDYPVEITLDEQADPLTWDAPEGKKTIPARLEQKATYTLKDGRKVTVINGKAFIREHGIPRPTSESQTRETMDLIDMGGREDIVIASSVPHTRAAVDALIQILDMRRAVVNSADIVTGIWLPWKELLAGLGELPAMDRADGRLRRVLKNMSPDSPVSSAVETAGKKLLS